jgi:hypothetical protein
MYDFGSGEGIEKNIDFGPGSRHGATTELWDSLQIAVAPIFANFSHAL